MNDVIIIGGGIVGLATALQLKTQRPNLKISLIEKEADVARHQTGHNSGVIHSGLYYKPNSLKAQNCIRGYALLINFCRQHDVPFELTGKIVVATSPEELPLLETLRQRGEANGLTGIRSLSPEAIREHEPHAVGLAGLFVPQTGIVDFASVAYAYKRLLLAKGGELFFNEKTIALRTDTTQVSAITDRQTHTAKCIINCAGLYSDKVALMALPDLPVRIIPFRGEYYKLKKEKEYLVKNLIYPVPNPAFPFLGVHFTRMAKAGVEAGPNAVLAFAREGYKKTDFNLREFSEILRWPGFQKVAKKYWSTGMSEMYRSYAKGAFTQALQKLLPAIQKQDLVPGGTGIRAQACDRDGGLVDDFLIIETAHHIHVCNAPSPAATSSLAIGETIATRALKKLS